MSAADLGMLRCVFRTASLNILFLPFFLKGHPKPGRRGREQSVALIDGRLSAAVSPRLQLPATPPPSSLSSTPDRDTPHLDSDGWRRKLHTIQATPTLTSPFNDALLQTENGVTEVEKVLQLAPVEPDWNPKLGLSVSEQSGAAASLSVGSLSDFSRPPSSLFSRSTDLASGRSSILSDRTGGKLSIPVRLTGFYCHLHTIPSTNLSPEAML